MLKKINLALAFTIFFLVLNPVFNTFGVRGVYILAAYLLTTLALKKVRISEKYVLIYLLSVLFFLTSLVSSVYNQTAAPLMFSVFFSITLLSLIQVSYVDAVLLIDKATTLFLYFLLFSLIGVLYNAAGGGPVFTLVNPDGRLNDFYLTTFSNARAFFIRPSSIYDEPGTFSFYICFLVAIRGLLNLDDKKTIILLFGGLITQSIAHLGFLLIWFSWYLFIKKKKYLSLKNIMAMILVVTLGITIYKTGIMDWAIERGLDFQENPWKNPRQRAYDKALMAIESDYSRVIFGFNPECAKRTESCFQYGENPLTPLSYGGALASWPYYAFFIFAVFSLFFSRNGLLYIGIAFLLLQRPYLLEFPYSSLFALLLIITFLGKGTKTLRL